MKLALPLALLVAVVAVGAAAAELHVPQQYATIQAAIDASANGDVVIVGVGFYREPLNMRGRRITLRSAYGPAATILDGWSYQTSILTARGGETQDGTRVEGFTFRNGFGTIPPACSLNGRKGGAIFLLNAGISVVNCIFEDNGESATGHGGAIFGCSANLAISDSRFERNRAAHGGAIYYLGLSTRRLTIDKSTFAESEFSAIRAVLYQNSDLFVTDSRFERNRSSHGGALDLNGDGAARATITGTSFDANHATHGGAVLATFFSSARLTIAECRFTNGTASFGGGVNLYATVDARIDITRCDFENDKAGFGGGLFATARGYATEKLDARIRIDGCRFLDNVADANHEAGLIIDQCIVDGPSPRGRDEYYGGGADLRTLTGGIVTVANSLFAGNSATRGGGLHASSCAGGSMNIVNNTIVDNSSGVRIRLASPKLIGDSGISDVTLTNSIVRGNDGDEVSIEHEYAPSLATVTFSDIKGGFAGAGNIDVPPVFVNPAARDYRLAEGSAGIDAGDNDAVDDAITEDLARRPRFADDPKTRDRGAGYGPRVDLGAYEFQSDARVRRRAANP